MKLSVIFLSIVLALTSVQAQAKRMGGGKSMGQQSHNVSKSDTPRPASPDAGKPVATPTNSAAATGAPAAAPVAPKPPVPAAAPVRPWGAMLGGLAAGLGLAWLASSMGLGAGFGEFLLIAMVCVLIFALVRMFFRRQEAQTQNTPYVFEGAAAGQPSALPQYNPHNVGNDSSARPVDTDPTYATSGSMIGSDLSPSAQWQIPAGFDVAGFTQAAKDNFINLQKAWDHSDFATLRGMMTDDMLREVSAQLSEREAQAPGQANVTEVLSLEAQLLGIEEQVAAHMASVEFSGMVREEAHAGPTPFREVWNLVKAKQGDSGWLVAGVQALQ